MNTRHLKRALSSEAWAILPSAMSELQHALMSEGGASLEALRIDASMSQAQTPSGGSVAVISLNGTIVNRAPGWLASWLDISSPQVLARLLRSAADNPAVSAIILAIDSPGGTVGGTVEAAAAVAYAAGRKRTIALAADATCSGAYWLASQATEIVCTPTAMLGSIGVITTHTDYSGMLAQLGIKETYIRSAPHKALGQISEPMTGDALADTQARVDALHVQFVKAVAVGRKKPEATVRTDWATGQVWVGPDAVRAGLADRLGSLQGLLAELGGAEPEDLDQPDEEEEDEIEVELELSPDDVLPEESALSAPAVAAVLNRPSVVIGAALDKNQPVLAGDNKYQKDVRVTVKGTPHMKGHASGVVKVIEGPVYIYGIVFDGMEDMGIHKWYAESELDLEVSDTKSTKKSIKMQGRGVAMNMKDISAKLAAGTALSAEESTALQAHLNAPAATAQPAAAAPPDTSAWPPEARSAIEGMNARLTATETRAQTAEQSAAAERDIRLSSHFTARAQALGQPTEFAATLRVAHDKLSEEEYSAYEGALERGAQAASGLLEERGSNQASSGDVVSELGVRARTLMAADTRLTLVAAQQQVMASDPAFAQRYQTALRN
ncbi:S49 family peptidase [Deinococcus sp.]|uniref:S49 family peptidase n=1 Tax=Deinococcus sp. TaxID=47478 RepID=UPI0025D26496|nr:S49 family peptidase [Deinococcus sp.]